MRISLALVLICGTACSPRTGLRVPDEVGDVDWTALTFATTTVFESGETAAGLQRRTVVIAVSDRADLCEYIGPYGDVDTSIDVRFAQFGMETIVLEPGRYVATTKTGPGTVEGPSDVAMVGFVYHREGGETLIHSHSGTSPGASPTIDELAENNAPVAGSFSYRLVKDIGTAQPADFDENEDGRMDYRKLDAVVEGTFVDAEQCGSGEG